MGVLRRLNGGDVAKIRTKTMTTTIELDDIEEIRTITADESGRINLGIDYAGKTIKVVVVEADK